MKKVWRLAVIIMTLVLPNCVVPSSSRAESRSFPIQSFVQIHKVVKIKECKPKTACEPGTYKASGSGVAIKGHLEGTLLLTAGHMCNMQLAPSFVAKLKAYETWLEIVTTKNEIFTVKIIASSHTKKNLRDICLIYSDKIKLPPVKISKRPPKIGDDVFAMAAPSGVFHPPTVPLLRGVYSGPMPDKVNALYTLPSMGGSSGAPVLNSQMKLIGIIYAAVINFHHVTLSIDHHNLIDFIKTEQPKPVPLKK